MLGTKVRLDFLQNAAAAGESAQVAPQRLKVATLVVKRGRTERPEYTLTDKLTVIGEVGDVHGKTEGLVRAKAARANHRREDQSYYVGAADKVPMVNGPVNRAADEARAGRRDRGGGNGKLEFVYRD